MGDMIKTGEIDTKHFLIAIVAIVAIVALAFAMVFVSGGFNGAAISSTEGAAYDALDNYELVIMDWACFEECVNTGLDINICKETCDASP